MPQAAKIKGLNDSINDLRTQINRDILWFSFGVCMKDKDDRQTVDVFSDVKPRGGYRPGAGRPRKEPTVAIRIPVTMLDAVHAMVSATKAGHLVEYRIIPQGSKAINGG